MANFNFNIENAVTFEVIQYSFIETECASQYTYKVTAPDASSVTFSLQGNNANPIMWTSQSYKLAGVEYFDWDGTDLKTVSFNTELYISFVLDNSGDPGRFNKAKLIVVNGSSDYLDNVIRENDSLPCDNPTGEGGTYDELTDTPNNKTGSALKLIRVNAAEDAHEYIDAGDLGNDLNYSQSFTNSSSVTLVHNLGKIPSVTIIDSSGNTVHGDIDYTDLNNLTITFNTAFTGIAYLN